MVVLLGLLLIFVGFVFAVARRGMLPGTSSEADPLAGHAATTDSKTRAATSYFTSSGIDPEANSRRRKLVETLIGLALIALGVLCVVFGT
jgi:hypothetical protein